MAFRCALKLFSKFNPQWTRQSELFVDARQFATKSKKISKKDTCPNKTCKDKKAKSKKSIWNLFKSAEPKKPPIETCHKRLVERLHEPDPDMSSLGGTPFKTCGTAYIIQKELSQKADVSLEPEDQILHKIEAHPDLKNIVDPMPPFESVEQRLIHLSEKKLHPDYKKYLSTPRRKPSSNYIKVQYRSRSGPISDEEVPPHLQYNKDCLDKKNIFYEFKRSEPPRQLFAKMLEMRQNQRPTMEKKKGKTPLTPAAKKK